jgi:hypothetical protein
MTRGATAETLAVPSVGVMRRLTLVPITQREAFAFVERHHRHHRPPRGARGVVACAIGDAIVGVAIVGRPVARHLQRARRDDDDDGETHIDYTAELTRLCTDGTRNAASFLLGAAWKLARVLGYRRLVTYTLPSEGGASLRGAGWICVGAAGGGTWSRQSRPRVDTHPTQMKLRWEITNGESS